MFSNQERIHLISSTMDITPPSICRRFGINIEYGGHTNDWMDGLGQIRQKVQGQYR